MYNDRKYMGLIKQQHQYWDKNKRQINGFFHRRKKKKITK